MKRCYSLLLAFITALTAMAYDFQVDGIYYSISSSTDKTVSVTNTRNYYYSGKIIIPEKVTYNDTEYSVTEIGSHAFRGGSALSSVAIPSSVTKIGLSAFYGCSSLTSLTIPYTVTEIDDYAFSGCFDLTTLKIEDSEFTLKLGYNGSSNGLFSDCPLETVYIGCTLSYSDYSPFKNQAKLTSLTIGDKVTEISSLAFEGCSGLKAVTIPNSVTKIGSEAFRGCIGLTSLTIPNSVTSIGLSAFEGCSGLASVIIPNSVTSIKEATFYGCYGLTFVAIPNSVTSIGSEAFSGCYGLTSVDIPNSVTSIGSSTFSGCSGLTSVTIPNSVTEIGNASFYRCLALTSLKIEDGESTLKLGYNGYNEGLFSDCPLETVYLGRTLSYNSNTPQFRNQTKLVLLTIGEMVTSIGESAFYGCSALATIISNAVTPPAIESNSFSNESYKYALVTVPAQSLSGYKEKWSGFYHLMGDGTEKSAEYHVDPAGALMNMISPDEAESITSLKLTGTLNGTDLLTVNKLTNLKKLDISGCTIVSGGMPYYETDNERFGAKDNTLGQYWSRALDLLAEIDLPTTLATLDKEALLNKKYLTALTIPSSVTTISYRALYGCDNIKQLILQDSDTRLYLGEGFSNNSLEYLYLGRLIYTDSDTYKYKAPFENSLKLKKVIVGRTVTKIESSQFSSCSNLTDLLLPNTLQSIGSYAFYGCTSLEHVAIPNPTESIGSSAFYGCSGLKELTLPGSVKSIGESAFAGCRQLGNVYVINPIPPVIESSTFDATTLTAATLHVPEDSRAINWVHPYWGKFKKIDSWTVGTTTEFVAENVSYHITSEADATVEISAVALGGSRAAATAVKIPSTVKFNDKVYTVAGVANNGFAGAPVSEVELPATVNYVGLAAFKGCEALTKVTVRNTLPPSADVSSFDEATYANAKLSVVEEAADAYRKHSVWGLFAQTDAPAEEPTDPTDPSDPSDPSDPTDPSGIDGVSDAEAARPIAVAGGIDFEGVDGNTTVEIYSINGRRVYAGPARRMDLAAGYYVVRIGVSAFKIMVM